MLENYTYLVRLPCEKALQTHQIFDKGLVLDENYVVIFDKHYFVIVQFLTIIIL